MHWGSTVPGAFVSRMEMGTHPSRMASAQSQSRAGEGADGLGEVGTDLAGPLHCSEALLRSQDAEPNGSLGITPPPPEETGRTGRVWPWS